jgi:hypothetical protein
LKDLAGALLVGPEAGLIDMFQQFIELPLFGTGVKETSVLPRCESGSD